MKIPMRSLGNIALFMLLCLVFTRNAYAYLDMGTGSYIFQLLMGLLLGGIFTVKIFWRNIKGFLKKLFSIKMKDENLKDR